MTPQNQTKELATRIALLALIETVVFLFIMLFGLLLLQENFKTILTLSFVACTVLSGLMYALRSSRYAELALYTNLVGIAILIALIEPLSGAISGATWVLYQLWPPIATLVMRRPRASLILAAVTIVLFVVTGLLPTLGIIAVRLSTARETLLIEWGLHTIILIGMTSAITLIGMRERQALDTALHTQEQFETQARILVHTNKALEKTNNILFHKNAEQDRMRTLISMLETPTITLADGVLFAPVVGTLDQHRAQTFTNKLLREVHQRHIRRVLLDLTGVSTIDAPVAQALIQMTEALRLLGCSITITGISAQVATTITELDINLDSITTARSPQEVLQDFYRRGA